MLLRHSLWAVLRQTVLYERLRFPTRSRAVPPSRALKEVCTCHSWRSIC